MSQVQGDGATLRTHLQRLARNTHRIDSRLAELCRPLAPSCVGVWSAFTSLNRTRAHGPAGPQPISLQDIESWQRLQRVHLTPWEVDLVVDLDSALRGAGR